MISQFVHPQAAGFSPLEWESIVLYATSRVRAGAIGYLKRFAELGSSERDTYVDSLINEAVSR
jgi:hypothetical protein